MFSVLLNTAPSYIIFSTFSLFLIFFSQGHRIGVKGCWWLTLIFGVAHLRILFSSIWLHSTVFGEVFQIVDYGKWFELGQLNVRFTFFIDNIALLMCQLVSLVSVITQVYSFWYLSDDPNLLRFQSYLQLFTFFMFILIFAGNLVLLFVGWEGVGLCSYLLISFWSSRVEARRAAIKAVALNRIGDCGFMIGIALLFSFTQSTDLRTLANALPLYKCLHFSVSLPLIGLLKVNTLEVTAFSFLVAAAAKSAQLGFHGWLADAMEGPTPVSALIHAATMVTAGVYLILRLQVLFALAPCASQCMALVGALSAFFGALTAAFQWDIKKVIAYSTCSQLGYMFCICGFQEYHLGFYHLVTHGYFKALLFLAAGILIHNSNGEQDMRRMGNLMERFPLIRRYFLVGSFSLIGLPGTAGYASKEKILDVIAMQSKQSRLGFVCQLFLIVALFFSVIYSIKVFYFVFKRKSSLHTPIMHSWHGEREVPYWLLFTMLPLVLLSIGSDRVLNTFFIAGEHFFLNTTSAQYPIQNLENTFIEVVAYTNRKLPLLTMGFAAVTFIFVYVYRQRRNFWIKFFRSLRSSSFQAVLFLRCINFFQRGWYVDYTLSFFFAFFFPTAVSCALFIEKGLGELIGPIFVRGLLKMLRSCFSVLQVNRSAFSHSALMLLGLTFFIILIFCTAPSSVCSDIFKLFKLP